jgi:Fe-S-cluster containining protein
MDPSLNWWYFQKTAGMNAECPFLTDDNDCSIHNTKPLMCRNFPLNTAHPHRLEKCQGIRKGKRVRPNLLKKIRNKENAAIQLTSEKFKEIEEIIGKAVDIIESEN